MVGVGYAAVNGAYGGALGFFVEADTFGAFVGYDEVVVVGYGFVFGGYVYGGTVVERNLSFGGVSVGKSPLDPAFVDGIIGTFGFAGSAVDTFVGDYNCHCLFYFGKMCIGGAKVRITV